MVPPAILKKMYDVKMLFCGGVMGDGLERTKLLPKSLIISQL
jgi:hypothetical protein